MDVNPNHESMIHVRECGKILTHGFRDQTRTKEENMAGLRILEGKYIASMDLYPQEAKEFNRIYPFYEFLKQGRFTTTRCKDCGHQPFPPRVLCPKCLSENLEWVDLPTRGKVKVKSYTIDFKKPEILRSALLLKIPLPLIWSCYEGAKQMCGKCESCLRLINGAGKAGFSRRDFAGFNFQPGEPL